MYSNRLVSLDSRSLGVRIWTKFGKVWRAVDPRCCNNSDFFRSAMQFRCSLIGLEATTSRAKEERENVLVYSAILTMLAALWLTFGRTFFWRWSPIRGIGQSVPRDRSTEGQPPSGEHRQDCRIDQSILSFFFCSTSGRFETDQSTTKLHCTPKKSELLQ